MAEAPKVILTVRSMAREVSPISNQEEWRVVFRAQSPRSRTHDLAVWINRRDDDVAAIVQIAREELHRISSQIVAGAEAPAEPPEPPAVGPTAMERVESASRRLQGTQRRPHTDD